MNIFCQDVQTFMFIFITINYLLFCQYGLYQFDTFICFHINLLAIKQWIGIYISFMNFDENI